MSRLVVLGYRIFLLVLAAVVASGCASSGSSPIKVNGFIRASTDINQDTNGRSSPVVVRVYQLKASVGFEQADFFSIYDNENAALGSDLLARDEFELKPGVSHPYEKALDPGTRFVGVLAAFRDIDNARWRAVSALPEQSMTSFLSTPDIQIEILGKQVSISIK